MNAAKDRKEDRITIAPGTLDRIREQNTLDLPIYEHFRSMYDEQMENLLTLALRRGNW